MKYWKEEISLVETMDFWKGNYITKLEPNEVFVFGANPQARHFAGAAKAALGFGAVSINTKQNKPGIARGLSPNNKTYALITKSLEAGYTEPETGITYHKEGFQSVSPEQIRANIDELYETAKKPEHLDKKFLVTYQYEAWPNGTPKKSLNGYTSQEMLEMFVKDKDVPPNIVFHESYKPHLEKLYKNKQSNGELVVYEDGKTIDIKEEDIVWTINSDERNPVGIHGAGGAKAAVKFGAKFGQGRGLSGQTYALVTKKSTGILYEKDGYCSVSKEQIINNIKELYEIAKLNSDKNFLITFQYETLPNGTPKKSLNGYTSEEMFEMFMCEQPPTNIVFHESYKQRLLKNEKIISDPQLNHQEKNIHENNYIAFTKVALPYGWMSNMAPYPVEYEGTQYKTTEALFQALRYKGYPEIQKEIIQQNNPMQAKIVAKSYKHLLTESGYELLGEQDLKNMKLCIDLKISQHPELAKELIETGNKEIIEDCSKRPQETGLFWGSAFQNGKWVGENILGKILMQKREELIAYLDDKNISNQDYQKEENKNYTYFFHLTSPFSNFHPTKFEYKGLTFISNEQFMMYSKAKNFNDEASAEKILELNQDPLAKKFLDGELSREDIVKDKVLSDQWNKLMMKVKKLGRGVQNYDEAYWESRRYKIVLFGVRLKFTQNPELKDILMATGNSRMIETNPYDKLSTMQYVIQKLKEEFSLENKRDNKLKP